MDDKLFRKGFLTREGVLKKLDEGWELGVSVNQPKPRAWMQPKLCHGGPSINVRMNTLLSMRNRKLITTQTPEDADAYWLTRFKKAKPNAEKKI